MQYKIKSLTSFRTVPFEPLKAQSLKFLADPKPPAITIDEIVFLFNVILFQVP